MAKATKAKQIILTLPNRVGTLAKVNSIISGVGANINAISARGDKRRAYFHILVDRHMKVKNALSKAKYDVTDEDVILVELPNKPGQMQTVAEKLAEEGIDILYIYGSAGHGRTSFCVLKTDNDKKAIALIQ
jgi:hypothetical protein